MAPELDPYAQFARRFPELADLGYTYDTARSLLIDREKRGARGNVAEGAGIRGLKARGLAFDPQQFARMRAELLKLENDKAALSQGNMTDLEKLALEQAVKTVGERYKNSKDVQVALMAAMSKEDTERLKQLGYWNKIKGTQPELRKGEVNTIFDNINEAYSKDIKRTDIETGSQAGDSPSVQKLVGRGMSSIKPDLDAIAKLEDPAAQGNPKQFDALHTLHRMRDVVAAQGDDFISMVPEVDRDAVRKHLATADGFDQGRNVDIDQVVIDMQEKLPQGVAGSSRVANDVKKTYTMYRDMMKNVSADMKRRNVPIEAAYDKQIKLWEAKAQGDPYALKQAVLEHGNFDEVARIIGVDPRTEQGRKATTTFIREAGTTHYNSARSANDALRDLRSGNLDFGSYYDVKKQADRAGYKSLDEAGIDAPPEPDVEEEEPPPTPPGYIEEQINATTTTEPEVDLLAGEEEEVYTPAEEAARKALAVPEEELAEENLARQEEAVQEEEADGFASDLINAVSETHDVPLPDPEHPLRDAFGTKEAREPDVAQNLLQSHKAMQPRDALTKAVQEQTRQKILTRASNLVGAAAQIPQGTAAESVAGNTAEAYKNALDRGQNPTSEAQRIAADTLYDNVSGDPIPGRDYVDDGGLYQDGYPSIQSQIRRHNRK